MGTMEGTCRYCGQVQTVIAEDEKEADILVTEECDCLVASQERKILRAHEKVNEMFLEIPSSDEDTLNAAKILCTAVIRGAISSGKMSVGNFAFATKLDAEARCKISLTEKKKAEWLSNEK